MFRCNAYKEVEGLTVVRVLQFELYHVRLFILFDVTLLDADLLV
jgi:hypothetical protein